jgi:hypothetical protein
MSKKGMYRYAYVQAYDGAEGLSFDYCFIEANNERQAYDLGFAKLDTQARRRRRKAWGCGGQMPMNDLAVRIPE